jgi:hypothetical protein
VDNLSVDGLTHFHHFGKSFQNTDVAKLLLRKNVYCYDYVDSHDKFRETAVPPKEAFYNRLKNEHISDSDYEHAQTVWNTLNMKFVGRYHDLFLLMDVPTSSIYPFSPSMGKELTSTRAISNQHISPVGKG